MMDGLRKLDYGLTNRTWCGIYTSSVTHDIVYAIDNGVDRAGGWDSLGVSGMNAFGMV